jgi:hypothetical protein
MLNWPIIYFDPRADELALWASSTPIATRPALQVQLSHLSGASPSIERPACHS